MAPRKHKKTSPKRRSPWLFVIPVALLAAVLLGVIFVQQAQAPAAAVQPSVAKEISVAEAVQKRDLGAFMLDVRQPEEWDEVHIPGATLIPLDQLSNRLGEVPKDQEVVVVCRSGNRSQEGRDILLRAGYQQVTSMAGGMNDWQNQGHPTVSGP
jgi:rhodanese-related sulfurtransferase